MSLPLQEYILAFVGVIALALLLGRLSVSGLARKYRFFLAYLVVDLVQTAAPFFMRFGTDAYGYVFFITESLIVLLYVLVVLELYAVLLRGYAGIAKMAQRYTFAAIVIAVALALLLLSPSMPGSVGERFFQMEAAIVVSLLAFIFMMAAFLAYYPVPLTRNALVYFVTFVVYFLSKAALLFLNNSGSGGWIRACSAVAMTIADACIIIWTMFLSSEGERRTVVAGTRWTEHASPADMAQRLRELNDSLLRARGK
jgi:hypothetical protein